MNYLILSIWALCLVGGMRAQLPPEEMYWSPLVQCLKWSMQERVDRIGNCSVERNPRCRLEFSNVCEKKIVCELENTASDYNHFWPRSMADTDQIWSFDDYYPHLCTDMCTLIRGTVQQPALREWMDETSFYAEVENTVGQIRNYDRNVWLKSQNWSRIVLRTFSSNPSHYISAMTRLDGCTLSHAGQTGNACSWQFRPDFPAPTWCSFPSFESACRIVTTGCERRTVCNLTAEHVRSNYYICVFLCTLFNKTVGNDYHNRPGNYDFKAGYLDPSTNEWVYNKWYNSRGFETTRMLNFFLYRYFEQHHDPYHLTFTAVQRGCPSRRYRGCKTLPYYDQYRELKTTNDTMKRGCRQIYDQHRYNNCTVKVQCMLRGRRNTQDFCKVQLWMYKQSLEWTGVNVKTSRAATEMTLDIYKRRRTRRGNEINHRQVRLFSPSLPMNETSADYERQIERWGRGAFKIIVTTHVHQCQ